MIEPLIVSGGGARRGRGAGRGGRGVGGGRRSYVLRARYFTAIS